VFVIVARIEAIMLPVVGMKRHAHYVGRNVIKW
jgi:hypothetical protein